ncbi:MAG: putative zinc-type alcohol dehydrogenase [Phenylobacterium sp.]|nr:putative zinc-type alcohol dehydrogenase [Phenylobacterium sp.]
MTSNLPSHGLQLRSTVTSAGEIALELAAVPVPEPRPDQVVIRVEAAPINPSDLGLLLGPADPAQAQFGGTPERPTMTAPLPPAALRAMAGRVDQSMPVGNEGAGVVVAAGSEAQHLIGKRVAVLGGAMFGQYRTARAVDVLVLPDDVSSAEGAAPFVNPLTALAMVETMRLEGQTALVHTAAASNLGQMLVKLCAEEAIALVNIVRKPEQAELLRGLGAKYVCDTSAPTFMANLTEALKETGATLAFDAVGGGKLANQILVAMEAAALARGGNYSRYGSSTDKQVYIYGALDMSPTELTRSYGMSWGVGGFLLTNFMQKLGAEGAQRLRQRVLKDLKTTFASTYTREISLAEALQRDVMMAYNRRATGEKYLINPSK